MNDVVIKVNCSKCMKYYNPADMVKPKGRVRRCRFCEAKIAKPRKVAA